MLARSLVVIALVGSALGQDKSVFDLDTEVDALKLKVDAIQKINDGIPDSLKALGSAVNSVSPNIARVDQIVGTVKAVEAQVDVLATKVGSVSNQIDSKLVPLIASLNAKVAKAQEQAETEITAKVGDYAKAEGDKLIKSIDTVKADVNKDLEAAAAAAASAGTNSVFINWGNRQCEGGAKKLYEGWTYGSYHDHRGGTTVQCMKNSGGSNGAVNTGNDGIDHMYPMRTDNCGGTPGVENRCGWTINCALCIYANKHCYLESGVASCSADGYKKVYSGWLYGSHHGHNGQHSRICITSSGDWHRNEANGAYMYPSLVQDGIENRPSDHTTRCHYCCTDA